MTDWKNEVAKLRSRRAFGRAKYGKRLREKHLKQQKRKGNRRDAPPRNLPPAPFLDLMRRWDHDYDLDFQRQRKKRSTGQQQYLADVMALTRKPLHRVFFIDDPRETAINHMEMLLNDEDFAPTPDKSTT